MIFSLPDFLNFWFAQNRIDFCPLWNGHLVYYQGAIHIGYWNHCWNVFQFWWHVYVERQDKSHPRIIIDLMTQSISYHWCISKNKWPRIDTWGTPHKIFEMLEYLFSILTKNTLSGKYECNQLTVSSQKPIAFNFSNSILWSIVSNAFSRFISITPVKGLLSKPFKSLSFKYERHKSVECFDLKQD